MGTVMHLLATVNTGSTCHSPFHSLPPIISPNRSTKKHDQHSFPDDALAAQGLDLPCGARPARGVTSQMAHG